MNAPRSLQCLQRWMQAVITDPSGVKAGLESPEARGQIEVGLGDVQRIVEPSRAQSSIDRLAVYGHAYQARLLQCMRDLFPVLTETLGESLFDQFAAAYIHRYPPRSYTLGKLADRFVQFLDESRPSHVEESWSDVDFVIDLARLEWRIDQVFDGPGAEGQAGLSPDELLAVTPDRWATARLVPIVCLRLLEFRFPVNAYYSAVRNSQSPTIPAAATSHLALTRRDYVVRRMPLSAAEFQLLRSLVAGCPVGEAIARSAAESADPHALEENLANWFQKWASEGFFQSVCCEVPGESA